MCVVNQIVCMGSGCGTVGRVVASKTGGPNLEYNRRKFLEHLFNENCQISKKEQRGRKWPISIDFVKTDGFVN